MQELAHGKRRSAIKRPIEDIPAFRQHLARNGLRNLAEFEARNNKAPAQTTPTQGDAALLDLRYRRAKLNSTR